MNSHVEAPMKMADIRKSLGVGNTMFSAMKVAMGLSEARMGFVSQFSNFIRENPRFKQRDVFHPTGCPCKKCADRIAGGGSRRGRARRAVLAA